MNEFAGALLFYGLIIEVPSLVLPKMGQKHQFPIILMVVASVSLLCSVIPALESPSCLLALLAFGVALVSGFKSLGKPPPVKKKMPEGVIKK